MVVRENTEDLYMGIEHAVTPDAAGAVKIITRGASERVVRFAFHYAVEQRRRKVTVGHMANILKLTDGLFGWVCGHYADGECHRRFRR